MTTLKERGTDWIVACAAGYACCVTPAPLDSRGWADSPSRSRDRAGSSLEVVDAHLAQIAFHNTKLSAICTLDEEHARQRGLLADEALARGENWSILHGVPRNLRRVSRATGTIAGACRLALPPLKLSITLARKAIAGASNKRKSDNSTPMRTKIK